MSGHMDTQEVPDIVVAMGDDATDGLPWGRPAEVPEKKAKVSDDSCMPD